MMKMTMMVMLLPSQKESLQRKLPSMSNPDLNLKRILIADAAT